MKRVTRIILKISLAGVAFLLLLLVIAMLLLRQPDVQNYISHKITGFISSKTHTRIELNKIYLAFPKSVVIEKLFLEDTEHDTLLYLNSLKVDINMLGLLKKRVEVNSLYLEGVNANIKRSLADSSFNFNFLIKAVSPDNKKTTIKTKTDTAGWQIAVDKISLKNIRGVYDDELTGTNISGNLGSLKLKMNGINLRALSFNGKELEISDAEAKMIITKSTKASVDTIRSLLPSLALNKLILKNSGFSFANTTEGQSFTTHASYVLLIPEKIDLNTQTIQVKSMKMDTAYGVFAFRKSEQAGTVATNSSTQTTYTQDWHIAADTLQFKKVDFKYDITNIPMLASGIDYNHLHLHDVALNINNAFYSTEQIKGDIQHISLAEHSGFILKNLTARASYNNHHAELSSLSLTTAHSHIANHLSISYPSIESLGKNISVLGIDIDLQNTHVALDEILLFAPVLKNYPPFNSGAGNMIALNGKIKGSLKDITATNLEVNAATATSISFNAHIIGLPDAANAMYDIQLKKLSTSKTDIQLIAGRNFPDSVNIPENIAASGTLKGSFKDASAQLAIQTSSGDVDADVSLRRLDGDTEFRAVITTRALDIGYILKDTGLLGPVTGNIKIKGQNFSLSTIHGDLTADIQSIRFNKYNYNNISLSANADRSTYKVNLTVKDTNLMMNVNAEASMANHQDSLQMMLNVEGADLQKLNLLKDNLKVSGKLNANVNGSFEVPNGQINLNDITLIKGDDTYRLGSFLVVSLNDKKHSAAKIKSGIINADYEGTMHVASLGKTLSDYVNKYFNVTGAKEISSNDTATQNFALTINVLPHPAISLLLPQLEKFNGADIKADFNSDKQQLNLTASLPGLVYKGNQLDNVNLNINSNSKAINYSLTVDNFSNGNFHIAETSLAGSVQHDSLTFGLRIHDADSAVNKLIVGGALSQEQPGQYVLRFDNHKVVFANQNWELPADNYIIFKRTGFYVHHFDLGNQGQLLSVHSEKDDEAAPLKIEFRQFELSTLSQVVENDTNLITGIMNGSVELRNLEQAPAFVSDLRIDSLAYKQNPIGTLQLKADNLSPGKYTAQVTISGSDNDVQVNGYYASSGNANQLNFKADVNKLQLRSVEGLTAGQIRQSSGYITGSMNVTGTAGKPVINGALEFKDVKTNVAYINSDLSLKDERVQIDGKGIYFHSFNILDVKGQKAVINGSIWTTDFKKMKFDLSVTTNRFMVLNTGIKDNPLFFGHVVLSSDLSIKGDETLPVIRANAKLLEGTDFTVVIPSSKITVDRGEGVVVLVDTSTDSADNSIMKKNISVPIDIGFKGIDLTANLDISKKTSFKLIVDKTSGDSLVVQGEGELSFAMDPSGKQNLTGTYTLSGGSYNASFQKVIKRQFKIKDGGSITWNGSPTDANVDITATYAVRSAPADLLSTELASATPGEHNAYQQQLNFTVLMSMKGELLNPIITFQLDMADQDKNAFGGTVYAKINSLNTSDPDDLNRQVFALLVLGSFMPTSLSGSGGGENPASAFARNSVNQILSDQLNSLSGNYIKGVDLNFGLQTNDMYGTTGSIQQNTLVSVGLKKEFFKSRLSVQVGTSINVQNSNGAISQNNTGNVGGDFDIEYKLTKEGDYRLKAFRNSEYDFIDGLIYNTGLGFVFTRNYDTLKQLFTRSAKENPQNTNDSH